MASSPCRANACQKFVLPHSHHPVLFCNLARVDQGKIHLITGLGRRVVESVSARWRKALVAYVEKKQDTVQLGNGRTWSQCEVDEVTCQGKRQGQKVTWFQYCGLLRRGDRRTLILAKMKVKATHIKQRGKGKGSAVSPGPITKAERKHIANAYVKGKKILMHSDGAHAYRFCKIPGVITDSVKHSFVA